MEKLRQLFSNPELRKRLIFTLVMLVIYRLGVHVSVPGVNAEALAKNLGKAGDLLNVVDLFSGGAFKKFSIFALGITPYITASIVLQLMGAVVPTLENLQKKEGEAGRNKINQWTRYLTVGLAFVQGFGIASLAQSLGPDVVIIPGMAFKLLCAFTLSTGSVFVMWIGEQITDRGIGNGISLLIFAGIVAGLPKRGFTNIHAITLQELDLTFISSHFAEGETVCLESMRDKKLLHSASAGIVVLNNGELAHKVTVVADRISKGAREAILAAGGTIQEPPCAKQPAK